MTRTLLTQALIKFLAGILLLGLLIFLPAGSYAYWQGWLLMVILCVPMFIAGIVMLVKSPDLLSKRLNVKEKENDQKTVVALSGLLFMISFVTAGLNWRLNWWRFLADFCCHTFIIISFFVYCGKITLL